MSTEPGRTAGAPLRRVLFVSGSAASATLRYRVRLPEEALRSRGIATRAVHYTDPAVARLADQVDVVVLYRVPAAADLVELLATVRGRPRPPLVTYDVDDLVFRTEHLASMSFLDSFSAADRSRFARDVALRGAMLGQADLLTASTREVLAEMSAGSAAPTALLPNGVGIVGARLAEAALAAPRQAGPLRVGYFSGSATHDADWLSIEAVVLDFLHRNPGAQLVLVGQVTASAAAFRLGRQVQTLDAVPWRQLPALLRTVDVNLAPLDLAAFTGAKSAIKWLEAALVQTPTVAAATGPFEVAVEHGRTGILASTPQQWTAALDLLAADADLRESMGVAARESALDQFGPDVQAHRMVEVLSGALASLARRSDAPRANPVVAGAPTAWQRWPVLLERYPWPDDLGSVRIELPAGVRRRDGVLRAARVARRAQAKVVRTVKRTILRTVSGQWRP